MLKTAFKTMNHHRIKKEFQNLRITHLLLTPVLVETPVTFLIHVIISE